MEPQKPFACTMPDCGMTFTNEDHLHVHTKKHDMVLQLGMEQKAAFAADQTPTPTRFIRNCEEVGLFQDLQNVNPFDEGFKRAMDAKHGVLSVETATEDVLHTPHLVFPMDADCTLYTTNNQRNITISRSSSDESGAVKEYETTTISKLTNEVTTISRVVKPDSDENKEKKDVETVSYTNNVIIQEIRKDGKVLEKKDERKDIPLMSQRSLDYVVDSLNDVGDEAKRPDKKDDDLEVIIKLPSGKRVKMKAVDDETDDVREKLKNKLISKAGKKSAVSNIVPLPMGTLIPVKILNSASVPRVPIPPLVKPKMSVKVEKRSESDKSEVREGLKEKRECRSAASKRYRERLREYRRLQDEEMQQLRDKNLLLSSELKVLKLVLAKHLKKCPVADDLKEFQQKFKNMEKDV